MSNLKYFVAKKNDTGAYELSEKSVLAPSGKCVKDEQAMIKACENALNWLSLQGALNRIAKLADVIDKIEKAEEVTEAMQAKRAKAVKEKAELSEVAKGFPNTEVPDSIALTIAFAITGSKLVNVTAYNAVIDTLTTAKTTHNGLQVALAEVEKELNKLFDLRKVDYMASFKCNLNLAKIENLCKYATTYTLNWGEKGIKASVASGEKIVQQVILNILADGYGLIVATGNGIIRL